MDATRLDADDSDDDGDYRDEQRGRRDGRHGTVAELRVAAVHSIAIATVRSNTNPKTVDNRGEDAYAYLETLWSLSTLAHLGAYSGHGLRIHSLSLLPVPM